MQESTEQDRDDWLIAREIAAIEDTPPEELEQGQDDWEPDEEDVIRERLRQIRQESAHIPVAEEKQSMFDRLIALFRKGA